MKLYMKLYSLFDYHKYWLSYRNRIRNDNFDANSERILDFKNGDENAIEYFTNVITNVFDEQWNGSYCAVVPSHDPNTLETPMHQVVDELCRRHRLGNDAHVLQRIKLIQKLSWGATGPSASTWTASASTRIPASQEKNTCCSTTSRPRETL